MRQQLLGVFLGQFPRDKTHEHLVNRVLDAALIVGNDIGDRLGVIPEEIGMGCHVIFQQIILRNDMHELLFGRQSRELPRRLVDIIVFILDDKIRILPHAHRPGIDAQIDPLLQRRFGFRDPQRLTDGNIVLQHDPAHIPVGEFFVREPGYPRDFVAHGKHRELYAHAEIA